MLPKTGKVVLAFAVVFLLGLSVGVVASRAENASTTGRGVRAWSQLPVITATYFQQHGDTTASRCCPFSIAMKNSGAEVSDSRARASWLGVWLTPMATGTRVATSAATPTPTRALPPPPQLLERLTRDRPGIWGSVGIYLALGTTYVILIGLFLVHLVKVREGGDGDLTE